MKTQFAWLASALLASSLAFAPLTLAGQEQTLLGKGKIEHGGYGAPVVKFTSVGGEASVLMGGRGGWIIAHRFVIGGAGYGLTNEVESRTVGLFGERYLSFGYGGLTLEYVINSDRLWHGSVELLTGAGAVGRRHRDDRDGERPSDDELLVIEPGGTVDLNVTPWFRISGGASYRFVSGADRSISSNSDLSAFAASLVFRFGRF